jgi:hypothetical protein
MKLAHDSGIIEGHTDWQLNLQADLELQPDNALPAELSKSITEYLQRNLTA